MNRQVIQKLEERDNPKRKKYHFLLWFGIAVNIILLYVFYLLLVPVRVLDVRRQPLPVVHKTVERGTQVELVADYCKTRDLVSYVTVTFINHHWTSSLVAARNMPIGCHVMPFFVNVPSDISAGTYYLLVEIDYRVNSLRREHYELKTETFEIIEKEVK